MQKAKFKIENIKIYLKSWTPWTASFVLAVILPLAVLGFKNNQAAQVSGTSVLSENQVQENGQQELLQKNAGQQAQTAKIVEKNDSPVLEAYVVSRCPFGIQMQRAMADAVKNMPDLAKYLKVRYIGASSGNTITSMHGDAEAQENLRQICIREEQPQKYWNYVACQMKSGNTAGCEKSAGINSSKLSACASDANRGVAYAEKDFVLDRQYNIGGSPTIVLNGAQISETRYGGRSSDGVKTMVCSGFNSEPNFCSQKLNTTAAKSSFSETY